MHVHIAGVSAEPRWSKDTLLPLLVANGVTTVRDMGGECRPPGSAEKNSGRQTDWSANLRPRTDA